MDDLLREFVGESLDMMEAVASDLVAWEANPAERSGIDKIFRTVHTVKGSSGFFDLPRVTAIAHEAEELLEALRSRTRAPDSSVVVAILSAFDAIKRIVHDVAATGSEPAGDDTALLAALAKHVRRRELIYSADHVEGDGSDAAAAQSADRADGTSLTEPVVRADPALPSEWRSVRVPLALLDAVMNGVSDLVLARNDMAGALRAEGIDPETIGAYERLSALLGSVRASIGQMRMVPLRHLFGPLPRVVRQVSDELGKNVRVISDGGEVEIDREVVEALRDPIVHVLRNAIDHGIERPAERVAAGKTEVATLRLDGRQAGNRIVISVTDDGAGINEQSLIERAIASGNLSVEDSKRLSPAAIANLVFLPGLSTAQTVTDISGRGVGMDVVKANVEKLGGTVSIQSSPGAGVVIRLEVPMTLTVISALAISVGGQEFAVPRSAVEEVLLCSSDAVKRTDVGGASMVRVRGQLYPLVVLDELLWGERRDRDDDDDRALVLCRLGGQVAIAIEAPDVRDHAELVIKPLPPMLASTGLYNGFSLPDSGRPMLVLDVEGLARRLNLDTVNGQVVEPKAPDRQAGHESVDKSWLCFEQLGAAVPGALPMQSVCRLLDLPSSDVQHVGGRRVARIGEALIPIVDFGGASMGDGATIRVILLNDGQSELIFPVRNVLQLVALTGDVMPARDDSRLLGVTTFDGRPVELFDTYRLFADFGCDGSATTVLRDRTDDAVPNLLIVADQRRAWAETILQPTLISAGYRVKIVTQISEAGEPAIPTIIVDSGDAGPAAAAGDDLIIRRADQPDNIVTAYDRTALLRALAADTSHRAAARPAKRKGGASV